MWTANSRGVVLWFQVLLVGVRSGWTSFLVSADAVRGGQPLVGVSHPFATMTGGMTWCVVSWPVWSIRRLDRADRLGGHDLHDPAPAKK